MITSITFPTLPHGALFSRVVDNISPSHHSLWDMADQFETTGKQLHQLNQLSHEMSQGTTIDADQALKVNCMLSESKQNMTLTKCFTKWIVDMGKNLMNTPIG
jgi:hypothetical protein